MPASPRRRPGHRWRWCAGFAGDARHPTRPQAAHEPRIGFGFPVRPPHPCDALANGYDRAPVKPGREAAWTPPWAALAANDPTGMRSAPYGAHRPRQAGDSTRGEGRTKGRAVRSRGSAHVAGVKAMRARAAAPSPPVRLPAGRDGAGAPPHGPDRARRPTGRQAHPTKPVTSPGPAADTVRPGARGIDQYERTKELTGKGNSLVS